MAEPVADLRRYYGVVIKLAGAGWPRPPLWSTEKARGEGGG